MASQSPLDGRRRAVINKTLPQVAWSRPPCNRSKPLSGACACAYRSTTAKLANLFVDKLTTKRFQAVKPPQATALERV